MRLLPALVLASAIAMPASATTFFDGFEGETAGPSILNYGAFANWTVTDGTVDLVRSGQFGITCRAGNYCVDLDGSSNNAGILALKNPIAIASGDLVDIVAWISGNQRNSGTDEVNITIVFSTPVTLSNFQFLTDIGYGPPLNFAATPAVNLQRFIAGTSPFTNYGFRFIAGGSTTMTLQFANVGGDNIGAILDDVSIRVTPGGGGVIPEPGTWAMLIAGFGLVGAAARRRRLAAA
ncbi:PEPxxWA-CTERM sorting domain-containing protein [Thermaurantiacus sp.]